MDIYWLGPLDPETGLPTEGGGRYTDIKIQSFAPQTDVSGLSLPVNEYTVDIVTADDIPVEVVTCELYDDRGNLWSAWPLKKTQRISDKVMRLWAASWLYQLDNREMAETVYTTQTAGDAIEACFGGDSSNYNINNTLKNTVLNGYAPAQTARERLTWILFAIGAYWIDVNVDTARIRPIDSTTTLIPPERTFWRPTVDIKDWVTAVRVTSYTFRQASSDAEWQADDGSYMFPLPWLATEQVITLTNPYAPQDAPENVVAVEGVYLVNSGNASAIATRMAQMYFSREEVALDVINNRWYKPGDKVIAYTAMDALVGGYIQQAAFRFGHQARSTLKLVGCDSAEGATLTVNYMWNSTRIGQAVYTLPVGYAFSIENPYLDQTRNGHRYIFRPETAEATGTMASGGNTVNVAYEAALDLYQGILHVIGVDEITEESSGGITIGVIA